MKAVVLATTPAALLPWADGTLLERLLDQLERLGAGPVTVLTRAGLAKAVTVAARGHDVTLRRPRNAAGDARALAALAAEGEDLLILGADVLTNDVAIANLLADPGVRTGFLSGDPSLGAPAREVRGRVVSVGSDHHAVHAANLGFLGVLRVSAADAPALAAAAGRVGDLLKREWQDGDVVALLAVALVRAGVRVGHVGARGAHWARPGGEEEAREAREALARVDEERVRMDATVKASDGFFTTFFVSPWTRHVARWAAHRGLTPNQVTAISMAIGVLAAAAMASGERWGLVTGAVLVQLAFAADCVDGQLARYTRRFSSFGAWLDSVFDRGKEYAVYAGLAIGAARAGDPVWALAGAALALQTARHASDFSYAHVDQRAIAATPQPPLAQRDDAATATAGPREAVISTLGRMDAGPSVWLKKLIAFPIGERFAVISLTAALWSPRTTFTVLLAWGALAVLYQHAGRILRAAGGPPGDDVLAREQRDDGPLARALGRLGPVVPFSAATLTAAAVLPLAILIAIQGARATDTGAAIALGWLVVVGGAAAGRPHTGALDWAVAPLLRAAEYAGILWAGALAGDAEGGAFAVLAVLWFHQYGLVYRARHRGAAPPRWLGNVAAGWEGRLVLAWVALVTGALPSGFFLYAAGLAVLLVAETIHAWTQPGPARNIATEDPQEDSTPVTSYSSAAR